MIVSITRLHLRSVRSLPAFTRLTLQAHRQIHKTPGLLRTSYRKEGLLTYWTLSIWESEEQLRTFRNNGAHLEAMKRSRQLADELQYIRFSTETVKLDWGMCKEKLHQKYRVTNNKCS